MDQKNQQLSSTSNGFQERTYEEFSRLTNSTPLFTSIIDKISARTQNTDKHFFSIMLIYYAGFMASMLHCNVRSATRGKVVLGNYCIPMAPSGFGKGYCQLILEKDVFNKFSDEMVAVQLDESFERHVRDDAYAIARKKNIDPSSAEERIRKEYEDAGPFVPFFDSGTKAAIRQQRSKIIAAHLGNLNLVVDEVGNNMRGLEEEFSMMLELFDTGSVKDKLVKNTKENQRNMVRAGITPATMLLFGTPTKVFDGGVTEEIFISMLQTGFARRSLFAWGDADSISAESTHLDTVGVYEKLSLASDNTLWESISDELHLRASVDWMHHSIQLKKPEELILLNYQIACNNKAKTLNEFAELERIELLHRHSKAIKLAGSLAVLEGEYDAISENTLLTAIRLVEDSGKAFYQIINRERRYAKVARYLASRSTPVTLADISEDLPFFKTSFGARREMLDLAAAYGRKNLITINRIVEDNIEFYEGKSLQKTDLHNLNVSVSQTVANGYERVVTSWDRIGKLLTLDTETWGITGTKTAMNWCVHQFKDGNRKNANAIPGFNLLVLDIDGTASLESVKSVFSNYVFATCTTKSHTDSSHRFRVVIPLNAVLKLDESQYQLFVRNILDYLPFKADGMSASIGHKWLTNPDGEVFVNDNQEAVLFDAFPFIPGTRRDDLRKERLKECRKDIKDNSKLILWFIDKINENGERNNHLFRLGMMLVESGEKMTKTMQVLSETNARLDSPLDMQEIRQIGKSIEPRYQAIKKALEEASKQDEESGKMEKSDWVDGDEEPAQAEIEE